MFSDLDDEEPNDTSAMSRVKSEKAPISKGQESPISPPANMKVEKTRVPEIHVENVSKPEDEVKVLTKETSRFDQPSSPSKSASGKKSRVNSSILQKRYIEDQEPTPSKPERKVSEIKTITNEASQAKQVEEQVGAKRRVIDAVESP